MTKQLGPSTGTAAMANTGDTTTNSTATGPTGRTTPAMTPAVTGNGRHALPPPADGTAGGGGGAADGFVHVLGRRWPIVVAGLVVGVLLGVAYLMVARPAYTSVARLRVDPLDPDTASSTGTGSGGGGPAVAADFLDTECVVIKSNAVLAVAAADPRVAGSRTMRGVARPIDDLKRRLAAEPGKNAHVIEVAVETPYKDEANDLAAAVVDAYKAYESDYMANRAKALLGILGAGRDDQRKQVLDLQQQMREIARVNGIDPSGDPAKSPAHLVVMDLRDQKGRAVADVVYAKTAYEEASRGILGDAAKVQAVDDELAKAPPSANPAEQLATYQGELLNARAQLADVTRVYLPNHPIAKKLQARVDQLTVASVVAAKQWQQVAESKLDAFGRSLDEAKKAEDEQAKSQDEYSRLADQVSQLKRVGDQVDNRMQEVSRSKGTGAMNISVLDEATVDPKRERPNRLKDLAVATALGLLGGVGLACVRDWTDDRLRGPAGVRAAAGATVLGAVPAIAGGASAADRGRIVQHDPFGEAAESYRTLCTALQYGLPARTKTLLVTSPVAGDGKSTTVANLAIAMAQVNKRVLVVDADFRAPVQHRLFGLKDYAGMATVLDGADTIGSAVQRTDVPGLDVLPCGPTPSNPAELLNDPAFADHLNDLADRYDLVFVDSPPVTAVADARILAALSDASILVVRMETSTHRQVVAARDGLRSVGARLVGVVVNGVGRRGADFGKARSYPSRPAVPAAVAGVDDAIDELADHARQR